jgi:hypothetical protein
VQPLYPAASSCVVTPFKLGVPAYKIIRLILDELCASEVPTWLWAVCATIVVNTLLMTICICSCIACNSSTGTGMRQPTCIACVALGRCSSTSGSYLRLLLLRAAVAPTDLPPLLTTSTVPCLDICKTCGVTKQNLSRQFAFIVMLSWAGGAFATAIATQHNIFALHAHTHTPAACQNHFPISTASGYCPLYFLRAAYFGHCRRHCRRGGGASQSVCLPCQLACIVSCAASAPAT